MTPRPPLDKILALLQTISRVLCVMDFWSNINNIINLPALAADTPLPNIMVSGVPSGVTLNKVITILKIQTIKNTNAGKSNAINGTQNIQVRKGAGAWVTTINLTNNK